MKDPSDRNAAAVVDIQTGPLDCGASRDASALASRPNEWKHIKNESGALVCMRGRPRATLRVKRRPAAGCVVHTMEASGAPAGHRHGVTAPWDCMLAGGNSPAISKASDMKRACIALNHFLRERFPKWQEAAGARGGGREKGKEAGRSQKHAWPRTSACRGRGSCINGGSSREPRPDLPEGAHGASVQTVHAAPDNVEQAGHALPRAPGQCREVPAQQEADRGRARTESTALPEAMAAPKPAPKPAPDRLVAEFRRYLSASFPAAMLAGGEAALELAPAQKLNLLRRKIYM